MPGHDQGPSLGRVPGAARGRSVPPRSRTRGAGRPHASGGGERDAEPRGRNCRRRRL